MQKMHTYRTLFVFLVGAWLPTEGLARSALTDSVDVKIPTGRSEVENSIAVSPLNSKALLISNIAVHPTSSDKLGTTSWISLDAGKTWLTSDSLLFDPSFGDPAVAFARGGGGTNGRFFAAHLDEPGTMPLGIHYKDATGASSSWSWVEIHGGKNESGVGTDFPCVAVNNNTSGQFTGRIIAGWQDGGVTGTSGIRAAISFDNGENWPTDVTIAASIANKEQRGLDLQWGRPDSSKVFACWARGSQGDPANELRFKYSNNGGSDWLPTGGMQVVSINGFDEVTGMPALRTPTAPTMAVDMNTGYIYLAYASDSGQQGPDVFVIKSTNNGHSWGSPTLVHAQSSAAQFHSGITWDDCTGAIVVVFFDSRHSSGNVHTYLSVKYPDEETWNEVRVSDASWTADNEWAGDYIGVAAKDGIAFPVWSDDRESAGIYKPYVSPVYLWSVTQASVTHDVVNEPAEWETNLGASGTDYLVLTSPTNVGYVGTASPSSPYTQHAAEATCTCETGHWKYVVKSTRPGFTSRGSDQKTFLVSACVD